MSKTSLFDLGPERLNKLLSIGKEEQDARDVPKAESSELRSSEKSPVEKPGSWIGRYRVIRTLGEGGMGMVYLAEQEQPIRRQVALKVIKPGMDSARVVGRFEAERQALALLDHPNIAQVYDAGTTDSGRPYFVMEYVQGSPITEYCDQHKLSIEGRLILFRQVCDGVQHAHQKGIIHRDIKPSNILVFAERDKVIGKIIDFGVAKAISQPLTERTAFTDDTQLLGTPEYMSPEQADMATEDIDTRSDIYSLGVLLYVLLTGVLPFDSATFREGGIEHIRKVIRETDPKTPSTRLTKLGEEAKRVAENRRTEIGALAKHLRRELEWIPLKAMRKERAERYRSASELGDDIENYLTGAPLIAGPPGTLYRLKKLVRRHEAAVAGVTAVAVALIAGLIVSTAMYVRAERLRVEAQEAAEREAVAGKKAEQAAEEAQEAAEKEATARADAERVLTQAQAVSDFLLKDILDAKRFSGVQELPLDSVLDIAAEGLESRFEDQPLFEASIRDTLGRSYLGIGRSEDARRHLELAYRLRVQHLGRDHDDMIQTTNWLCWAYRHLGRHEDAIRTWTEQIEILGRLYGEEEGWRMVFMHNIGAAYTALGKYEEAEAFFDEVLTLCERSSSMRTPFVLFVTRWDQGANYLAQGRYGEAERILSEALEPRQGSTDWRSLLCTTLLAEVHRVQGRYEQAQQLCEATLATMRQTLGDADSRTVSAMCRLGRILIDRGRFREAEALLREAASEDQRSRMPDERRANFEPMNALAVLLTKQKGHEEAEPLFEQALKGRQRELGEDHPKTLETINDFGVLRREQQRYDEAESLLRQVLYGRQHKLGPDHPACFESMHELAVLYKVQGKYDDAERLLLEAVEGRRLKLGDEHPHTLESWNNLIELYEAWGKPEKAEEWLAKLPDNQAKER